MNMSIDTMNLPAVEERLQTLANRRVGPVAYTFAGLLGIAGFVLLLAMPEGWAWRVLLALVSAVSLIFAGRYADISGREQPGGADPMLFCMLVLVAGNILLPMWMGLAAGHGVWLIGLSLVAAAVHHRPLWLAASLVVMCAGWFGAMALDAVGPQWAATGTALLFAQVVAAMLFVQRRVQLAALADRTLHYQSRAEQLETKIEEFRTGLSSNARNNSEMAEKIERLTRIAETDEMTGLANRRFMMDFLQSHWPIVERAYRSVSAIYLDLNDFHEFNHRYGYRAGDVVLNRVAAIIKRYAGNSVEVAARVGNDSFMLILPGSGKFKVDETAHEIATRISRLLLPEFGCREKGAVSVSIGVASLRLDGQVRPMDLIAAADRALAISRDTAPGEVYQFTGADKKGHKRADSDAEAIEVALREVG